jgi:glycosyltransferase involved in cell wall biosynthesis
MEPSLAVCIPTIPSRGERLASTLESVRRQTRKPDEVQVSLDEVGVGAAANRNNAWRNASSDWIAFVDDDDTIYPNHLEFLLATAMETNADLVYPWFDLWEGPDPLSVLHEGKYVSPLGVPFGEDAKQYILTEGNFIPITVLVKRSLLETVGGFPQPGSEEWPDDRNEDWGCWQKMLRAGAKFVHAPKRTWRWHWHGEHTSGRPWK